MGMWNLTFITGIVYLFYLLIGGSIFMFLNKYQALNMKHGFEANSSLLFTDVESILLENFSQSDIDDVIKEWKEDMAEIYFSNETAELEHLDWTYSNSFFFAFHLCSTIGYGDIYPSTNYGRILVVLYTLIGMPLHVLFFKILGESFARSYQEIMLRVKGDENSPGRKALGNLGFFLPCTIVFYVLPSVAFMYTENWNFIDGVYYSFITLSTVGLGDYVAGSQVISEVTYTLYKLIIFVWMIYGLAFTELILDFLTHLYQMYLLFTFKFSCKECDCKLERLYVDIEKMDIHFKLIRAEAVKAEYSMWSVRERTRQAIGFRTNHMISLAALCERIQGEIMDLLRIYVSSSTEVFTAKSPKDASRLISKEKFPVKRVQRDAFPVRTPQNDRSL